MTGPTEVATSTISAMSKNPVLLFLLAFNLIILIVVLWIVSGQNDHYETLIKTLMEACKK